jgi:hypothetical protein
VTQQHSKVFQACVSQVFLSWPSLGLWQKGGEASSTAAQQGFQACGGVSTRPSRVASTARASIRPRACARRAGRGGGDDRAGMQWTSLNAWQGSTKQLSEIKAGRDVSQGNADPHPHKLPCLLGQGQQPTRTTLLWHMQTDILYSYVP